jgi:hypothetical protein
MNGSDRITTAEAARRLGKSPSQVRRMVAAGRLRGEMERRPQGTRLWVLWDAASERAADDARTTHDASHAFSNGASPHAATDEVRWLRERLEASEQAQAELRRLLLAAHQTIDTLRLQLPPPRAAERAHEASTDASATPHDAPSMRRAWWQFWRRRG